MGSLAEPVAAPACAQILGGIIIKASAKTKMEMRLERINENGAGVLFACPILLH